MAEVHVCPGCGLPVVEGEKYLVAQEYENAPGLGQRDFEPEALAKGAKRRFHVGHFHKRIGNLVFEVERD
jgi:hypothetical protein